MKARAATHSSLTSLFFSFGETGFSPARNFGKTFSKRPNFKFPFSPKIALIIVGVLFLTGVILLFKNTQTTTATPTTTGGRPLAPVPLATKILNKEFTFPIKDGTGKEISKIKYTLLEANLQDEILVKGQRARSVEGRVFLILNIKIQNTFNQGIQINSRDYVRLILNDNKSELIAADIHNDPVEVQAISTKTTRIGYPIKESDKNFTIQVGEINGKKETFKLTFE